MSASVHISDAIVSDVVCTIVGDGRLGYPESAPFDAIHVGAAAPVVPQAVSTV